MSVLTRRGGGMSLPLVSLRYPKQGSMIGLLKYHIHHIDRKYIKIPCMAFRKNTGEDTRSTASRKAKQETMKKSEASPQHVLQQHPLWTSRYSISVFVAGMITLGLAIRSLVYRMNTAKRRGTDSSADQGESEHVADMDGNPILFPDMETKLMSPLLLAAETAAKVDETAGMSVEDLENLEIAVRTLLSSMDAQLEELKVELQQHALPQDALDQLDALVTDDMDESDLSWLEFELYARYCSDQEKRTFRSLLYNRSVQLKLLEQVERHMHSRGSTEDDCEPKVEVNDAVNTSVLFTASGNTIPHPNKKQSGGEDAFFIDNQMMVFGIADGVGGWAGSGVDPAEYSKRIVSNCQMFASLNYSAKKVVSQAFEKTEVAGSCTIIVAKFHPLEEKLDVVSVGDCGMRIVRDGQVVLQTDIQEHAWNQPYQLSHPQFNIANTPEDALEYSFHVQKGDVIILGSDGFFDNFWDDEIADAVAAGESMRQSCDGEHAWEQEAEEISQRLLELAEAHSIDEQYASPYAREKQMMGKPEWARALLPVARGGKLDDITVAVAVLH
jgi:protein phosphatase PTC7